jgi:mRNA deadenylase 3'-5' endonuclease subunit Ccr4
MISKLLKHTYQQVFLTTLCIHARRLTTIPSHSHRISSYNVLSSHLAEPSYFTNCYPEYLDADYRFESLLKKMDREVEKNAIICLQEVSADW